MQYSEFSVSILLPSVIRRIPHHPEPFRCVMVGVGSAPFLPRGVAKGLLLRVQSVLPEPPARTRVWHHPVRGAFQSPFPRFG